MYYLSSNQKLKDANKTWTSHFRSLKQIKFLKGNKNEKKNSPPFPNIVITSVESDVGGVVEVSFGGGGGNPDPPSLLLLTFNDNFIIYFIIIIFYDIFICIIFHHWYFCEGGNQNPPLIFFPHLQL